MAAGRDDLLPVGPRLRRENKPYDQFVRELLISSGSDFRDGPSDYYRAVSNKDPQSFVEMTALTFMGVRLGCGRLPWPSRRKWTFDDDMGMAAFFAKMGFKATSEWKEEIVFFDPKGGLWNPRKKEGVKPKFLDGDVVDLSPQENRAVRFDQWLAAAAKSLVRPQRRKPGVVLAVGAGNRP